ncbi:MAG: hypothetical protein O3B09_04650 [Proteobacteria bacterium]|nr:hypothetical protein [Pseudomonadota bacterium]
MLKNSKLETLSNKNWNKMDEVSKEKLTTIKETSGVYVITHSGRNTSYEDEDEDKDRILYIGQSGNLRRRISSFIKSSNIEPSNSTDEKTLIRGHIAGWKYTLGCFKKKFPLKHLYWTETDSKYCTKETDIKCCTKETGIKCCSKETEYKMLKEYFLKYGNLPPLNHKFNWLKLKKGK